MASSHRRRHRSRHEKKMEVNVLSTNKKTHKCFAFQAVISEGDRISQLPDEILHHILSFLPASDIVRTSALSTRWLSLWTSFTIADLHFYYPECNTKNPFRKTRLPERVRICNLELKGPVDAVSVNLWVDKLLKHMVENLHLHIHDQTLFRIPDNLSNSESLTSLRLYMQYCTLIVPDSMCFPRLKNLCLGELKWDHSLQRLLSGCTVLEDLELNNCDWMDVRNITISIPSLQRITISACFDSQLVLSNLSSLTEAEVFYLTECETHNGLTLLAGLFGVKSLTLSSEVFKAISFAEDLLARLPTFHNLTHLEVHGRCRNCVKGVIVSVVQKSPNLHSLEIYQEFIPNPCNEEDQICNWVPQSFQCSIRNFKISNFDGTEGEIYFLKYMLENAIHLEKMSIAWLSIIPVNMEMQEDLKKQLRQLSKGSTNCVIEFFEY